MESRAEKLYQAFCTHSKLSSDIANEDKTISSLMQESAKLQEERNYWDYNNPELLKNRLKFHIEDEIMEQENKAEQIANDQLAQLMDYEARYKLNYIRFSSWYFGKNKGSSLYDIIHNSRIRIFNSDAEAKPNNYGFVFNFSKAKIFIIILSFLILGPAYLIYLLVTFLMDIFMNESLINNILGFVLGVAGFIYWMQLLDRLLSSVPILKPILIFVAAVWVTLIISQYIVAHVALRKEADKFLATQYPNDYLQACYDSVMGSFQNKVKQMESNYAVIDSGGNSELVTFIRESLRQKYDQYSDSIAKTENDINSHRANQQECFRKLHEEESVIEKAKKNARVPVSDRKHNDAVLTDYVTYDKGGQIGVIKHDCRPSILVLDDLKSADHSDYDSLAAEFIYEFYIGLMCENSTLIIDYNLIDTSGGGLLSHNDKSRNLLEKGLITNNYSEGQVKKLINKVEIQRNSIFDVSGTGSISKTNPAKLSEGNDPYKYLVVIHYGKTSRFLPNQNLQLYKSANLIGFLPVFIMTENEYLDCTKSSNDEVAAFFKSCERLTIQYK